MKLLMIDDNNSNKNEDFDVLCKVEIVWLNVSHVEICIWMQLYNFLYHTDRREIVFCMYILGHEQ